MTMKFYMAPGSCSTGLHIILEKLELLFEVYIINIPKGQNRTPEYLSINPKGTIPTLVLDDGTVFTEYQSIAYYLAASHPKSGLLPRDAIQASFAIEVMAYVVNTLHGQGFTRIFTPDSYLDEECNIERVKTRGNEIISECFTVLNHHLESWRPDSPFNISDSALFYVEFWADKLGLTLPHNCQKHYETLLSDPVIKTVLAEEGYH